MATSDPLTTAAARPRQHRTLAWSPAALLEPRRALHIGYFGFAIAALLVLSLLVPGQTSRGPLLLATGPVIWAAAATARWWWQRRTGDTAILSLEPAQLFLVVLVSTYVVFAFDLSSTPPQFSANTPDTLPGLLINSHAYFVLVFTYLLIFVGWYGLERGRLLETALAVQVFLVSLMFESFLAAGGAIPALALMAVALALLRMAPWEGVARPVDRAIVWLAVPLGVFVGVAAIATVLAVYPAASLTMTARMAVFAFLALLLFDAVREDRQRWLIWMALTAPAVTQGALVTLKVLDIARVMGFSFAFGDRIQLASNVDPNPLGLSLAIGILLIAAALPHISIASLRWIAVAALALLLPALVVAYSVPALMGLAAGLAALTILYACRSDWRAWRRPATWVTPASFLLIGLVVVALYAVPSATRNGLRYTIDDPTTGRSRVNLWTWSVRDIKEHPVLGAGPGYYRGRAQFVQSEFPFRDVTKMLERRHLLGGDGSQWHIFVLAHPHSLILAMAEGMGIVGLLALAVVGASVVGGAVRIIRRRDGDEWWFTALALGIVVATFVWSLTALGFNLAMLPLTGWLAIGIVAIAHRAGDERTLTMPQFVAGSNVRRGLALSVGVAVLLLLVVRPVGSLAAAKVGRDRFANGDFSGAEAPLALAAAFDPLDATASEWVSFARLRDGDTNGAVDALESANRRLPDDPTILALLGDTNWLAGHTDAAEGYYRRSIATDRWQAVGHDTYTSLALLQISQGRRDEALQTFAEGFFVSPSNVYDAVWVHAPDSAGVMLDDAFSPADGADQAPRASEALSRRLGIDTSAETPVAGTLNITSVFDVMEQQARDVLPRDRERGVEMLYQVGVGYENARLYGGAVRVLSDAVAIDPAATYIRYDLAQAELNNLDDVGGTDDLKEVVRQANTSTTYDLRKAFAERDLALAALRLGAPADAIPLMQDALEDYRWAYLPFAYPVLANSYDALGDHGRAEEYRAKERYLTRK